MSWISLLNKLVTRLKKEPFGFDNRIPISYLIRTLVHEGLSLVRGFLYFKKNAFVDSNVILKCKKQIHISSGLRISRCCYIDALSVDGIRLGQNVSIGKYTTIECTGTLINLGIGLKVGDNVGLGSHGFWGCAGGIEVGNDTIFGNYVSLHSENHNFKRLDDLIRRQGVSRQGIKIGSNCWIGAKVTILDGAVIGNGCVVAAGAVVRGHFPDNCVLGGVPARILKMRYE
ncbi:MAG TPA: acyltransferase [Candidatus Bacteroides avicola]|uniref:Acyltransferase n=1 Tax=Candidatus Bacteroides avicola TaxID=2838468 RepID=A0A9D2HVT5_9BACE|nr:acyltransferase [Candidatus Bacteroides avicola]